MVLEQYQNAEKIKMSEKDIRKFKLYLVCFLAALLAGLTIWSLDGTITWTTREGNWYSSWDEIHVFKPGPVLQGLFAFSTVGSLFLSVHMLISYTLDMRKGD
ncbi:MAG: hypothetical protein NT131_07265 [Methanomassiliicoccales archaeon]|nr:hypothetical protein [Methanomassiliicoccales archaeon]